MSNAHGPCEPGKLELRASLVDITALATDAIVNAANAALISCRAFAVKSGSIELVHFACLSAEALELYRRAGVAC